MCNAFGGLFWGPSTKYCNVCGCRISLNMATGSLMQSPLLTCEKHCVSRWYDIHILQIALALNRSIMSSSSVQKPKLQMMFRNQHHASIIGTGLSFTSGKAVNGSDIARTVGADIVIDALPGTIFFRGFIHRDAQTWWECALFETYRSSKFACRFAVISTMDTVCELPKACFQIMNHCWASLFACPLSSTCKVLQVHMLVTSRMRKFAGAVASK